jgi:hypothetical protein
MSAATDAWVKGGREVPRDSIVSSGGVFDMSEAGRRSDAEDDDVEGGGKRVGSILRCSKSQFSGEGRDPRKAISMAHYLFQSCCRRRRCFDGGCKNKQEQEQQGGQRRRNAVAGAQRLGTETGFQNSISVSAPKEESLNQGVCCRFDFATVLRLSITCKHWRGSLLQFSALEGPV